jgi:hypothetical protein
MLSFIPLGSIALGIERILHFDFGSIEKVIRPGDWVVERLIQRAKGATLEGKGEEEAQPADESKLDRPTSP